MESFFMKTDADRSQAMNGDEEEEVIQKNDSAKGN